VHPHIKGIQPGTTLRATVDRLGERLITAKVAITEPSSMDDLPMKKFLHAYMMRHFPDMNVDSDRPLVHDLVTEVQTDQIIGDIFKGDGELKFHAAENEELASINPTEVLGAYHVRFSYRTSGVKVLHNYLAD
jgi:hypothetical protein